MDILALLRTDGKGRPPAFAAASAISSALWSSRAHRAMRRGQSVRPSLSEIDTWCEQLNCAAAPSCSIAPAATLKSAEALSREALVEIVSGIQARLYLHMDGTEREFWNPGRERSCWVVCRDVQDLLHRHGLVPGEELPASTEGATS